MLPGVEHPTSFFERSLACIDLGASNRTSVSID